MKKLSSYTFVALVASVFATPNAAHSEVIRGVLSGSVTSITATDLQGLDASAAFGAILPFGVGSPVTASFEYDTTTGSATFGGFDNLMGTVGVTMGGSTFGGTDRVSVLVGNGAGGGLDTYFVSRSIPFGNPQEIFMPAGWTHSFGPVTGPFTQSTGRSFRIGLFDAAGLLLPDASLPRGPYSTVDFTASDFQIFTDIEAGGQSVWTVPGGGSFAGRRQSITGTFTRIEVGPAVVPEPSGAALLSAAVGLAALRRVKLR